MHALTLTRVECNFTMFMSCIIVVVSLRRINTQLNSVYNELSHFLVRNGPTANFTLTSSCLRSSAAAMTAAHRQPSNVTSIFSSPKNNIAPLW